MTVTRTRNRIREIYFVQAFELKLIKIGVSNDTRRRMVSMQTFSPDLLAVLGVQICMRGGALEGVLHQRFAEFRQHGEWFSPAPALLTYIAENTVAFAAIGAERDRLMGDDAMTARIDKFMERDRVRKMQAMGLGHLT